MDDSSWLMKPDGPLVSLIFYDATTQKRLAEDYYKEILTVDHSVC